MGNGCQPKRDIPFSIESDSNLDAHSYPDLDPNAIANLDANFYRNPNLDADAFAHVDQNHFADPDLDAYRNADRDQDSHPDIFPDLWRWILFGQCPDIHSRGHGFNLADHS